MSPKRLTCLSVLVAFSACASSGSGTTHVLFANAKARISIVQVLPHLGYYVTAKIPFGSVVIRLDGPGVCGDAKGSSRVIVTGDPCLVHSGEKASFPNTSGHAVQMLIIDLMSKHQALTIEKHTLAPGRELEDASERNETLVIAKSPVRLRETRDSRDDSKRVSGKAEVINLKPLTVSWLQPGTYAFTNLLTIPSSFVLVEW